MTQLIHRKGQGCLLFKRDLSRAFRQFPVDPADLDKLGFEWRGDIYIERVLAMGLRTAGIACQKATNIIVYISEKKRVDILNYFDDLGGAERKEKAQWAFNFLGGLFSQLGFAESVSKACEPATRMVFLGILFDTVAMVMEVSPERVQDTLEEVGRWSTKQAASRKELQQLLGKLHFVCKCVRQGRVFVLRLLNLLRTTSERGSVKLSDEAKADIKCFQRFLPEYNGVSLIPDREWSEPGVVLATDTCLAGCRCVRRGIFPRGFPSTDSSEGAAHIRPWNADGCSGPEDMGLSVGKGKTESVLWQRSYCSGPVFYLHSSLLKLSKLWDPNFSFNYLKQIHFLSQSFENQGLSFMQQSACNEYWHKTDWYMSSSFIPFLCASSWLSHHKYIPGHHSPLLCHTKITQCILKQNKENTNV